MSRGAAKTPQGPVRQVRSAVVWLPYSDIDTDQIIPAAYISGRTPEEFARGLFRGKRERDPSFVLNRPEMIGRSILLAGRNFGCGSSREAAVWALVAGGFRAVIATSFGDIFEANALKNGLLPVRVEPEVVDGLGDAVRRDEDCAFVVDLEACTVSVPSAGVSATFAIAPFYRDLLLSGSSELDYLLGCEEAITRYEHGPLMHAVAAQRAGTANDREDQNA